MFRRIIEASRAGASLGHFGGLNSMFMTPSERIQSLRESVVMGGARAFDETYSRYSDMSKLFESDNPNDQYRAGLTMLMLERTEQFINNMKQQRGEAVVSAALGDLAPRILDVVRIFYPNQIANVLTDIQPIDGQVGSIFTLRPRYSQTHNNLGANGLNVNAGQEIFVNPSENYASETKGALVGTGDGGTQVYNATLPFKVRPGSLVVTAGAVTAVDNGSGGLSGTGLDSGTIDYTTGALALDFTANVGNAAPIIAVFRANTELSEEAIRSIEFDIGTTPVEAKIHPIKYKYSAAAGLIAQAHLATDVGDTMAQLAGEFLKVERDNRLIRMIDRAATAESSLNFNATMTSVGYDKTSKYAEIAITLDHAESIVQAAVGRGGVDWVLVGINAATVFSQVRGFRAVQYPTKPVGPHVIGYMKDGTIPVVKVPNASVMGANDYVFGFKGYMMGESAAILAEWIPVYFTPEFNSPTLQNERGLMSLYDMFINNAAYYRKGTISNFGS